MINLSILTNLIYKSFGSIEFYLKCHQSKYFHVIFCLLKYFQYQNLLLYLCYRNNNTYDLQCELFKIHYFPFYIVSSLIVSCFELCFT